MRWRCVRCGWGGRSRTCRPRHDRREQVAFIAHPHQIPRLVLRKKRRGVPDDRGDLFESLPHRDPADGVAGQFDVGDAFGTPGTFGKIGSALNDAKEGLLRWPCVGSFAAFEPADGAFVGDIEAFAVIEGLGISCFCCWIWRCRNCRLPRCRHHVPRRW
jgi:hypothetical protein